MSVRGIVAVVALGLAGCGGSSHIANDPPVATHSAGVGASVATNPPGWREIPPDTPTRADVKTLADRIQSALITVGSVLPKTDRTEAHEPLRDAHAQLRALLIATRKWLADQLPTLNEFDAVKRNAESAFAELERRR